MKFLLISATVFLLAQHVQGNPIVCDCGFQDENGRLWTDIWYSDYSSYDQEIQKDKHYAVMGYTIPAKYENTMDRVFDPKNVIVEKDGSIQLAVRKNSTGQYTSASFGTKRDDILYGTFRLSQKTTKVPGTVAAFYFFRNNTCEIDMESISYIQNPWKVYFSVQPQEYNADGSSSNTTNRKQPIDFDPTESFHEYRFDWVPDNVTYYLDGKPIQEINHNVPTAPGRVLVNHWTDGNEKFSKGPPTEDALLSVAKLTMFYNISGGHTLACQQSQSPCQVSDIVNQKLLPNPSGSTESTTGSGASTINTVTMSLAPQALFALIALLFIFY